MLSRLALSLFSVLGLCSCSSVGIYSLENRSAAPVQAPSRILVEPFSAPLSAFQLGERTAREKSVQRDEIVQNLARSTASQIRTHAADSAVLRSSQQVVPGAWIVRGQITRVDQGSRALRAGIGLGMGRTEMRTRVSFYRVTTSGLAPLIRFNTTGTSGLEPGAALGLATGGVGTAMTVANAGVRSLPGVSTDIDRTSYEIAAVLSVYLERHGLLGRSRQAIHPRMKGQLPTMINLDRAIPAPLRTN